MNKVFVKMLEKWRPRC